MWCGYSEVFGLVAPGGRQEKAPPVTSTKAIWTETEQNTPRPQWSCFYPPHIFVTEIFTPETHNINVITKVLKVMGALSVIFFSIVLLNYYIGDSGH